MRKGGLLARVAIIRASVAAIALFFEKAIFDVMVIGKREVPGDRPFLALNPFLRRCLT